jgi:hypothetical protein
MFGHAPPAPPAPPVPVLVVPLVPPVLVLPVVVVAPAPPVPAPPGPDSNALPQLEAASPPTAPATQNAVPTSQVASRLIGCPVERFANASIVRHQAWHHNASARGYLDAVTVKGRLTGFQGLFTGLPWGSSSAASIV